VTWICDVKAWSPAFPSNAAQQVLNQQASRIPLPHHKLFLERNCDHTPPVLFLSEEDAAIPEPERGAAIPDNLEA